MKELDVLLTRYVDERFGEAPVEERLAFESLLEQQDPLIYAYCLGQSAVPARFETLIRKITDSRTDAGR